jgi:hypothetical protein
MQTLLHIFLFETPMTFSQNYNSDAILSILRSINEKIDEYLQNRAFAHLVRIVRAEGNIAY